MATQASLITTVYNEAQLIEQFIDSIEKQTHQPTEVVIVDAGSTDNTLGIIEKYIQKHKISTAKYRLITKKGATRSEGRNIAISKAKNKIVVVTDAGCRLKVDWFKKITLPFQDRHIHAVAGFYLPEVNSSFQEALASFVCTPLKKLKPGFLPSSRSVAFKKDVWLKIHGYPDELNFCEDLVFDQKVIKAGYNFSIARDAIVYWPQRKNIAQAFKQFYQYAYGDGQIFFSDLQTHSKKIALLYIRYLFFAFSFLLLSVEPRLLPIAFGIYLLYVCRPMAVYSDQLTSLKAYLWIPVLKITVDFAVLAGSFMGLLAGRK